MRENGVVTIPQYRSAAYGALELKRSYQKNLGMAVILAGMLHCIPILGLLIFSSTSPEFPKQIEVINDDFGSEPVSHTQPWQEPVVPREKIPIATGIAKAVPDGEAPDDATIASQHELGEMSDKRFEDILAGGDIDSVVIIPKPEESLPQRGEFVFYDEEPVALTSIVYEYPPLALQAGIEGTVWIEALVDKNGIVRDAYVVKPSDCRAGFEEVALEAAYKIKYKPAISNGQPVAVRVTYQVSFRLK